MPRFKFPDPRTIEYPMWRYIGRHPIYGEGIVHIGPGLGIRKLKTAFRDGIYPTGIGGEKDIGWECPPRRAIVEFHNLHVPRSLGKVYRSGRYKYTIDKNFKTVVWGCSLNRKNDAGRGSWISDEHIRQFTRLHEMGIAHSVETWDTRRNDGIEDLVGGLFGVDAGGVFCGVSMFHWRSDASKCALLHLIEHLRGRGSTWLDAQVMSPHIEALGGTLIERNIFLDELKRIQKLGLKLF